MQSVAGAFIEISNRIDDRLSFIFFEETLLDITATRGMIFEANSRSESFLETVVKRKKIVERMR